MSFIKFYYEYDGKTRAAWYQLDPQAQGIAGRAIGLLTFGLKAEDTEQDLPADKEQYSYTHGGQEYQTACRGAWADIRRRNTRYKATATSEHETRGRIFAEGSAFEVRSAVDSFDGWVGSVLNVYEVESGYEDLLVDQFTVGKTRARRTRYGVELRERVQQVGDWE